MSKLSSDLTLSGTMDSCGNQPNHSFGHDIFDKDRENDNLKKTNEMLNYKLDQLTRDRRFKITKSKKTYEIRDNLIFLDGIEIGFFVDSVE